MTEKPIGIGRVVAENRRLRDAIKSLIDELESSESVDTVRGGGLTDSETAVDTEKIRERLPPEPDDSDPIEPPWERDGFDSKSEWLADKRE